MFTKVTMLPGKSTDIQRKWHSPPAVPDLNIVQIFPLEVRFIAAMPQNAAAVNGESVEKDLIFGVA